MNERNERPAMNCIFCKIVAGEIPARKVHEDDEFLAFHDIRPAAPVHFLVIPKQHLPSLLHVQDTDQAMLGRLLALVPRLAREQGLGNGFKTSVNTGEDGGQEVDHLHVHVLGGRR
jgi:histidine triad (HIT) family protein